MITTRTPFRLSLLGGGSDYSNHVKKHGGLVVGLAMAQYAYCVVRRLPPLFNYKHRFAYSQIDAVNRVEGCGNPAIRGCLKHLRMDGETEAGLEITHFSDLPGRCGVGSSSSFVVGLLNALHCLKGEYRTPAQLRDEAIHVEQVLLGETVGSQDQAYAAHGGLIRINFRSTGSIDVTPIPVSADRLKSLESHLLMVYTGTQRTASEVASTYVPSLAKQEAAVCGLARMAEEGYAAIRKGEWDNLGRLLDLSWRVKSSLSPLISTATIGRLYLLARLAGAMGGKLNGAGGGGVVTLLVDPSKRAECLGLMKSEFSGIVEIPISVSFQGSTVIHAN